MKEKLSMPTLCECDNYLKKSVDYERISVRQPTLALRMFRVCF